MRDHRTKIKDTSNSSPQSLGLSAVEADCGTYRSIEYYRDPFTVHREVQSGDKRKGTEYNTKTKLRLLIRDATLNGVFREFMTSVYLLTSTSRRRLQRDHSCEHYDTYVF